VAKASGGQLCCLRTLDVTGCGLGGCTPMGRPRTEWAALADCFSDCALANVRHRHPPGTLAALKPNASLQTLLVDAGGALELQGLRADRRVAYAGRALQPAEAVVVGALLAANRACRQLDLSSNQLVRERTVHGVHRSEVPLLLLLLLRLLLFSTCYY
jgi:hypothetical protein